MLAKIFDEETPKSPKEKEDFVLRHKIALWDVLRECDIEGASDSSIKNAVPNDMEIIFRSADIKAVFCTGSTAAKLYKKFIEPKTGIAAIALSSTSPANAKVKFEELCEEYKKIIEWI